MNLIQRLDSTIDLEVARKVLLGLCVGVLVLIPIDALWISFGKIPAVSPQSHALAQGARKPVENLAEYQKTFEKNTIFGIVAGNSPTMAVRSSIAELAKDYRLKGVVFMGEAEAILEDAKTQKTFFVKIGQPVGDLTVKEIKEGFMILSYLGEEIKLEVQ